ncbi:MAG: NirD/YgiW/YdeI family stress tolerance protein [Candidatus Limnocylindrales bacterium]
MSLTTRALLLSAMTLLLGAPAAAQEEVATTTISAIDRGETEAMVYLEGAALYQEGGEDDEYLFSDGTGVIEIDVDDADEGPLPLFELIGIEGTRDSDGIDVSSWERLPIMTPAVIVEEPQVIEAFWGWIVAYGGQAPEPAE